MSNTKVPTEADWRYYEEDMDAKWAHDQFAGKTLEEVLPYFIVNSVLSAAEDISHMPEGPFQYYIMAFERLFLSESVRKELIDNGDPADAASYFLKLVKTTLTANSSLILPVIDHLMPVINFVAENQALFRIDQEIYGDLNDAKNEIIRLLPG